MLTTDKTLFFITDAHTISPKCVQKLWAHCYYHYYYHERTVKINGYFMCGNSGFVDPSFVFLKCLLAW